MITITDIGHFINPHTSLALPNNTKTKTLQSPPIDTTNASSLFHSATLKITGLSAQSKKLFEVVKKSHLEDADIQIIVDSFKSSEFYRIRHMIAQILSKQSPEEANNVLKAIFKAHAFEETKPLFSKLSSLLSLQKVEDAIRSEFGEFKGAACAAIDISASSKRNIESKETQRVMSVRAYITYHITATIEWFIDSLLLVLQLTDVTDNDATKIEKQMVAQMRYMAFRENIAIVSAWLVALGLYTGSIATTAIIAAVTAIGFIAAVTVYTNFIKPCPDNVHPGKNRTKEASRGEIASIHGRDEIVKKLFDTLEGNTKTRARRYPMIRGGTGIGKSDLANAMAMYLTSKDCPKEWKGKKLFVVSTADIVTGGAHGKMEHLHHIKDVLEGREENAILFFTEIHVGFQEKTFFLGQELKTLCDAPGGFPYMVFATTDKEYMEHIAKDTAFARRLDFFDIKPTTDEVTELIVSDMVTKEASDIFVTNDAIKEVSKIRSQMIEVEGQLAQVFEDCPQPSTSIAITAKALANARHPWFKDNEKRLQELKNQRNLLDHQLKLERGVNHLPYSPEGKEILHTLSQLDDQILAEENILAKAKSDLEHFRTLVKKTSKIQEVIEKAAIDIKKATENGKVGEEQLKHFIFLLNYMKPAMDECLKELSQHVESSSAIIDKNVMKEFIKDEAIAYLRKVREKAESKKNAHL